MKTGAKHQNKCILSFFRHGNPKLGSCKCVLKYPDYNDDILIQLDLSYIYNTYKNGCHFYLHIQNAIKYPWTSYLRANNRILGLSKPNFKLQAVQSFFNMFSKLNVLLFIYSLTAAEFKSDSVDRIYASWKKHCLISLSRSIKNTTIRFSRTWYQ